MKKRITAVLIVITLCLTLCSCTEDNHGNVEIDFPETESYEDHVYSVDYGVGYGGFIDFVKEYPYSEGYQGHYLDSDLFWVPDWSFKVFDFTVTIPVVDLGVDERLLLYFRYEDDVYQKAKAYLMEDLELSDDTLPMAEYNGYVFYDIFLSRDSIRDFNCFVYNDNNNTIILLGLYYTYCTDKVYVGYEFPEFLNAFYGGWYDFSK